MKWNSIRSWSAEKLSQSVFYVLIGLSVLIFGLFFLVGYDMPFEENPDFNAPLFTDVLLCLMTLLLALSLFLTAYSLVRSAKMEVRGEHDEHGVPDRKIVGLTWIVTLVVLLLTFVLGSSAPMLINGESYTDWLWLKVADMFVFTSVVMLAGAIGAVVFGATRYIRKERK